MAMQISVDDFVQMIDECGRGISDTDVVFTSDNSYDFYLRHDMPDDEFICENGRSVFVWYDIRVSKGKRRGDLYITTTDDGCLAYFSGEA